jgi:hypothetical protein
MRLYYIVNKNTNELIRGPYPNQQTCEDVLATGFQAWRDEGKICYTECEFVDCIENPPE